MTKDTTFTIIDERTGKKVGEQTVAGDFAPMLLDGQRAEKKEAAGKAPSASKESEPPKPA
jgi:hypothetical protein